MMQRGLVVVGIWLVSCGPKSEPVTPVDSAPSPAPVQPAPTASAEPVATTPAAAVEPESPPPVAEAKPSIHDVCFAMCDKLKAKCAKSSFESCRVNCGKYESPTEGCEGIVLAALACARDAADLVCANVAPESCAKPFQKIAACNSGKSTTDAAPITAELPPGFAVYENASEQLKAPMPQGVTRGEGNVIATAKHADGAVYSIRKLPRPEGKLNEKVFLKIAMALFGRCSDKMKMQGMVDKPGRTSINYTTKCPDGSEEAGLFWATERALFIASAKGAAGRLGPTETFLYGFEAR